MIQPSAVWKAWKGTIEGCADSARRSVTCPRDAAHVPTYVNSDNALSNSDVSTSQPTPSRRARQMPAMIPSAAT